MRRLIKAGEKERTPTPVDDAGREETTRKKDGMIKLDKQGGKEFFPDAPPTMTRKIKQGGYETPLWQLLLRYTHLKKNPLDRMLDSD